MLKRLVRAAATTGVIVTALALVAPLSPAGAASGVDTATATGSGTVYSNININASAGPLGQNPTGTASFTVFGSLQVSGPVTCLQVTGPDMGGGTLAAPTTAVLNVQSTNFGVVTVELVDNGGNGSDVMNTLPTNRAPSDCSPFTNGILDVLTNGRATVFDAPPFPTSKDQCKHGGYAQFGFKNQGQCVDFVNHNSP